MKPYVICHMCTMIDGKILSKRWGKLPGKVDAASLFERTADQIGIPAWIVGTTTMKEFQGRQVPLKSAPRPLKPGDYIASPRAKRFAIGVDAKAVLRFQKGDVDGDHVVLLLTEKAGIAYRSNMPARRGSAQGRGEDTARKSVPATDHSEYPSQYS